MSSHNSNNKDFLGTGWGFPPTFDRHKRTVEVTSGEDDILQSLRILFSTGLGERFMRSKYGSRVPEMAFEPMGNSQRAVLRKHVIDSIYLYEPRIEPLDVTITMDTLVGRVEINVDFRVSATNNRRNFVYPFYILEGTEVSK